MWQYNTKSPEQTSELAVLLAGLLKPGMVICLDGDLGAGKTLFVKAAAKALGVEEEVTSPTFALVNVYQGKVLIYHFDLYRLQQVEQLADIGFDEYVNGDGISLIEWPNEFKAALPEEYLWIEIIRTADSERSWRFLPQGEKYDALSEELKRLCQYSR